MSPDKQLTKSIKATQGRFGSLSVLSERHRLGSGPFPAPSFACRNFCYSPTAKLSQKSIALSPLVVVPSTPARCCDGSGKDNPNGSGVSLRHDETCKTPEPLPLHQCNHCGLYKGPDDFYRSRQTKSGLRYKCKECTKRESREWRKNNQKRKNAYNRNYYKRNRQVAKARQMVDFETRSGRLQKEPCEVCGTTDKIQAHHEDYTKPLDVVWLCPQHHADRHRGEGVYE